MWFYELFRNLSGVSPTHTANGVPARKRDGPRRFNDSEVGFILSTRTKTNWADFIYKMNLIFSLISSDIVQQQSHSFSRQDDGKELTRSTEKRYFITLDHGYITSLIPSYSLFPSCLITFSQVLPVIGPQVLEMHNLPQTLQGSQTQIWNTWFHLRWSWMIFQS